ncbi:glycosyltransferase family 2 protein [Citricoccus sp. K5]|uniref:glycosyltransferase family 2 protein n=1 Tax=Citricoccus sp. K5 TaxID=2653135 RepID=UPI001F2724AA|nr:galactosyltransferase-related protein [Citricoccus sp. K5]
MTPLGGATVSREEGDIPPSTSVLIITGGRDQHLARVLAGLEISVPAPNDVVVVFMNQPTGAVPESTLEVVTGHVSDPDGLPLAAARNRAAALAQGEVLVFLDVDCIPASGTVGELSHEVRRHPGSLVMGTPRYLPPGWQEVVPVTESRDDGLRAVSVEHAARQYLGEGPSAEWSMVWTLVLALSASDFSALGGFDEGFRGYGAEDTDFAFRARDAGLALVFSAATVFHQPHGVYRPPLHHFQDILVNARHFKQIHGSWPMGGWLGRFRDLGLVLWDPAGAQLEVLREPTAAEIAAALDEGSAY